MGLVGHYRCSTRNLFVIYCSIHPFERVAFTESPFYGQLNRNITISFSPLSMNSSLFPISLLKKVVPSLTNALHKGQLGKIGIIGGCLEYTGAPFYAGISAQRCVGLRIIALCSGCGLGDHHLCERSRNSHQMLFSGADRVPRD